MCFDISISMFILDGGVYVSATAAGKDGKSKIILIESWCPTVPHDVTVTIIKVGSVLFVGR